ncbi:MAG TPA: hypothetical protein VEK08_24825 [Planctomycetota bacterium]|nr:hypothetical protein [Planctomycetota bacterium]
MEVQQPIIKRIEDIFATPSGCEWDQEGEGILMPAVQTLIVLYGQIGGTIPDALTVRRWKTTYLNVFDKTFHTSGADSKFTNQRRTIIEETFDKLEKLARGTGGEFQNRMGEIQKAAEAKASERKAERKRKK